MLWFREQPRGPGRAGAGGACRCVRRPGASAVRPRRDGPRRVPSSAARGPDGAEAPARHAHRPRRRARRRIGHDAPDRRAPAPRRRAGGAAAGGPAEPDVPARRLPVPAPGEGTRRGRDRRPARIEWRHATSVGLQYAGRLVDGTQLPVEGPDWVTWNPSTDSTPEPSRQALRSRAHDPGDRQRARRVPGRAPRRTTGRRRRHQPSERRDDGPARLAPERARRGRLLPAARPAARRADLGAPDRPAAVAGSARPLPRRGREDRLRRLLDRAPRPARRRRPVSEPREPHARPLPRDP